MLHNFAKDGNFTNVYLYFIKNAKVSVNLNVNNPVHSKSLYVYAWLTCFDVELEFAVFYCDKVRAAWNALHFSLVHRIFNF